MHRYTLVPLSRVCSAKVKINNINYRMFWDYHSNICIHNTMTGEFFTYEDFVFSFNDLPDMQDKVIDKIKNVIKSFRGYYYIYPSMFGGLSYTRRNFMFPHTLEYAVKTAGWCRLATDEELIWDTLRPNSFASQIPDDDIIDIYHNGELISYTKTTDNNPPEGFKKVMSLSAHEIMELVKLKHDLPSQLNYFKGLFRAKNARLFSKREFCSN